MGNRRNEGSEGRWKAVRHISQRIYARAFRARRWKIVSWLTRTHCGGLPFPHLQSGGGGAQTVPDHRPRCVVRARRPGSGLGLALPGSKWLSPSVPRLDDVCGQRRRLENIDYFDEEPSVSPCVAGGSVRSAPRSLPMPPSFTMPRRRSGGRVKSQIDQIANRMCTGWKAGHDLNQLACSLLSRHPNLTHLTLLNVLFASFNPFADSDRARTGNHYSGMVIW